MTCTHTYFACWATDDGTFQLAGNADSIIELFLLVRRQAKEKVRRTRWWFQAINGNGSHCNPAEMLRPFMDRTEVVWLDHDTIPQIQETGV